MALVEQVVTFPLVGGVDEKAHPRLCSRLLVMNNCRQFDTGSLGKRYGTNCVGAYNARFGGGTPPTGELLTARGNELVRVGSGQVDTVSAIGSTDCVFKGRASEALVYRKQITAGETYVNNPDVAYGNGYRVFVVQTKLQNAAASTSTTYIVAYVLDANDNVVVSRQQIDTSTTHASPVSSPRVVIVSTTAIITWTSGTNLKACTLNLSTLAFSASSTLVSSVVTTYGYAIAALSDRVAIAYENGSGVNVGTWTSALSVQTAAVVVSAQTGILAFGIDGVTGATLYPAWAYDDGSQHIVTRAAGLNPSTLATVFAATTVNTESIVSTTLVVGLGVTCVAAGTSAHVAWSTSADSDRVWLTLWTTVSNAGSIGTIRRTPQMILASKPFIESGYLYAVAQNVHSTHATLFLVHLYDGVTPATTTGMRLVASFAVRQAARNAFTSGKPLLSSVPSTSSGRYAAGAIISGAIADSYVATLLDIRIGNTKPVAAEAGGLLVLSGGCPSAYDGGKVAELGFAWEPDYRMMSASAAAGGSLTADTTYYYLIVFEWRFRNGAVVRSIPSYPASFDAGDDPENPVLSGLLKFTTTSVNKTGSLVLHNLNLTNKQLYADQVDAVNVIAYRTVVGSESGVSGATFYRATSVQVPSDNLNLVSGTTLTLTDALADSTLATRPVLYTTGGALPSELPPSASHVAVIGGRVWLSGTDDDTIWFSHVVVEGEAPAFSGSLTIAPFEGGRVVGMAALDEKKIILKESSIYLMVGDGPGIDGLNGTFSSPTLIPSTLGCIDARSIVTTPAGVLFLSQNGLALIGRDLSVTLVGKAVEDTVSTSSIVAATVIPDQDIVRFPIASTMRTVEFDLFHGGAWGTNTYSDPASGGSPTIVGATYCQNAWWYLTSEGKVFTETKSHWKDVNGGSTAYVVQRARLRYISMGDIQGCMRVWNVSAVGEWKTAHDLTMKVYIDHETSTSETTTWLAAVTGAWGRYQAQHPMAQQECEGFSVEVYDATPTAGTVGTGQGFVLFGVSAEVGLEKPLRRVPAAQTG